MAISVKTKERLRRRMAVALPHAAALLACAAALGAAVVFTGRVTRMVEVSDTHGGTVRLVTAAQEPAALLAMAGFAPQGADDVLAEGRDGDTETLQILRAYTVDVTADGETRQVTTTGATAAELLAELDIGYDEDDELTPAADETVAEGGAVTLRRIEYEEYTEEETVPATEEFAASSLYFRSTGYEELLRSGQDGLDLVTYRDTYVDGELAQTEEIDRETEVEMIPSLTKVYGEGAAVSRFAGPEIVDGAPVEGVAAVYTSQRATAYSASATAKGASGRRLTYGTVAVNPNVIPYGSLMYIASTDGQFVYGYAYAADTGTAMMDGRAFIDLYYETYAESVRSAVIYVNVYVLDSDTAALYKEENDAILASDDLVGY